LKIIKATKNLFNPPIIIIIIDALDECNKNIISQVISLLSGLKNINSICFRALVISRDIVWIKNKIIRKLLIYQKIDFFININLEEINSNIRSYYKYRLYTIKKKYCKYNNTNNNKDGWVIDKKKSQVFSN
jgi:hypothetical protein